MSMLRLATRLHTASPPSHPHRTTHVCVLPPGLHRRIPPHLPWQTAEAAIGIFSRFVKSEKGITGTKGYVKALTHSLATIGGLLTLVIACWDVNTLIEFFTKADDITKPILVCASCVGVVFGLWRRREWSED